MTPGTAAGCAGLTHELLLHRSVEELLDFVVPFDARSVAAATNVGRPVADSRGKVASAILQITEKVAGNVASNTAARRLRFWPLAKR